MEIVIKTILRQIFTQCAGTQDIIKKLASCGPCRRKSGFKTVAFLLRLSIYAGALLRHFIEYALLNVPVGTPRMWTWGEALWLKMILGHFKGLICIPKIRN